MKITSGELRIWEVTKFPMTLVYWRVMTPWIQLIGVRGSFWKGENRSEHRVGVTVLLFPEEWVE